MTDMETLEPVKGCDKKTRLRIMEKSNEEGVSNTKRKLKCGN